MALAQLIRAPIHTWPASDSFRYIRDFLACRNGIADFSPSGPNPGPGYEIVDEYYVANQEPLKDGDWCVFKSNGESNDYPHYLRLAFGANRHLMMTMLHWDVETHIEWGPTAAINGTNNAINHGNYQGVLSIHADLDECHIITQSVQSNSVRNWWHAFGRIKSDHTLYDGTAARAESAIVASANRIIHLDRWPGWARIGRKIYNWDNRSMHVLTISNVNEANHNIIVEASYDKAAGSILAEDVCIYGNKVFGYDCYSTSTQLLNAGPSRTSQGTPLFFSCRPYVSHIGSIIDAHYDHRLGGDIWLGGEGNCRGRLALAKETSVIDTKVIPAIPNHHGYAWVDEESGQAWRTYQCYDNRWIAFMEMT